MHSGFIVGNNYKDNDSMMINLSTSSQIRKPNMFHFT